MCSETRRSWGPLEVVVASSVVLVSLGIAVMWLTSCGGREVSRRIHCASNLRQVGLALVTLENNRQTFPGYLNRLGGQPASWVLPSLAYLDRMDLVKGWEGAVPGFPGAHATRLDFLLCPSDSPKEDIIAPLSYVANAGIPDRTNANNAPADKLANGVFQNGLEEVNLPAMTQAHPGTSVQERRINFGHDRDFDEAPTIDFSGPSSFHPGGAKRGHGRQPSPVPL